MSQSLVVDQSRDLPAESGASGASAANYLDVQHRKAWFADFEPSRAPSDWGIQSASIGRGIFEWTVR
jgi:hypothetical protein